MNNVYIPVLNTIISSVVSLVVAFGTWHVSMKKDREKQTEEVKDMLVKHREEYLSELQSVQHQVGIIDYKIQTLSDRVDKHNNLVERTYKLEEKSSVHEEQIKNVNQRIESLEDK